LNRGIIEVEQLAKGWGGRFRLGPLDFTVAPAEILSVLGPKGAGKTTLMRLLWGALRADHGQVRIHALSLPQEAISVRLVTGYVPDDPPFHPYMKVGSLLSFVADFYPGWNMQYALDILEHFDVDADSTIGELKKAARTKLALAAALGHCPSTLLLDEPVNGLERADRREILKFLKDLADLGTTIVLTADASDDLDGIAHIRMKLKDGKMTEFERRRELDAKFKA